MFVFGNLLIAAARVLNVLLQVYFYILVGRAICSWVNADPRNALVRFLYMATEPPLRIVRRLLPASTRYSPIDIAFLVLVIVVMFLQWWLVPSMTELGVQLGGGQLMR
jgi:YggT family protein